MKKRTKKDKEPSIFRQELKRDWNTFKSLKGYKKLEFLWDYYKLPATIFVTLVTVICIFAHMLWEGQQPRRLRIYAVLNTEQSCVYWFNRFEKALLADGKPGNIDLNEDQPFDYDSSNYYIYEIEVMSVVSSQRMDVAICNADMYEYLLAINACMPLDTALPTDLYEDLSGRGMIDYTTAGLQIDENGDVDDSQAADGYYAVNLEGTEFEERYNQTEDTDDGWSETESYGNASAEGSETVESDSDDALYAVIISNTDHLDDSVSLIRALTQETLLGN